MTKLSKIVILLFKALLFTYQSSWMKRLLKTYGNETCLVDASYKTTSYALPVIFMVVKTNGEYEVVDAFVCEGKGAENIKSGLKILKA